jgi:hypothetical protein
MRAAGRGRNNSYLPPDRPPSTPWHGRQPAGDWRNVDSTAGFVQYVESPPPLPIRSGSVPGSGVGTSKDRFEWKPIAARLGRDGVPRNYPCDPVGENIITIEGNHIALTTIATGWKSLLDRNR